MRIAILGYAHPFGVDQKYGAERICWYLCNEFIRQGHQVTVFSVRGCRVPGATLVQMDKPWDDSRDIYFDAVTAEERRSGKFDFIQSYAASGAISRNLRQRAYALEPFFQYTNFKEKIIAYSKLLRDRNGGGSRLIYFGIPEGFYAEPPKKSLDYVVWIGRIDAGKAPDIAIETAKRAGKRIILLGPSYHYPYFVEKIWPHIDNDKVIWLRAVDDDIKKRVLERALCFLSTNWSQYHEMLDIVNLESLACSCPIIGWGNSNQPSAMNYQGGEIIQHGFEGFLNEYPDYSLGAREQTIERAVEYINCIDQIDRQACRDLFRDRFTSEIMANEHLKYYKELA